MVLDDDDGSGYTQHPTRFIFDVDGGVFVAV